MIIGWPGADGWMLVLANKNASCLNVPVSRNNLQKRIKNGVNGKSNTVCAKSIGLAECRKALKPNTVLRKLKAAEV